MFLLKLVSAEVAVHVARHGPLGAVSHKPLLGCADLDELTFRAWRGDRNTILLEPLNVKADRLPNELKHFVTRLARGDAPGKIRHVRPPTVRSPLYHYHVSPCHLP